MTAYATRRDVYKYGLPRGMLGGVSRLAASSTAATDILELDDHGFETGDDLLVRAVEGGTLSAPLVAGTTYYAIRLTDSTFKLATSEVNAEAGTAVNLTSDGSNMLVSVPLPVDDVLEFYSRWVDDLLPSHVVPMDSPYPVTIIATVAELAAKKLLHLAGHTSESVNEAEIAAKARLERYAQALPVRDARATSGAANLAVVSVVSSTRSDPRGWGGGGSIP